MNTSLPDIAKSVHELDGKISKIISASENEKQDLDEVKTTLEDIENSIASSTLRYAKSESRMEMLEEKLDKTLSLLKMIVGDEIPSARPEKHEPIHVTVDGNDEDEDKPSEDSEAIIPSGLVITDLDAPATKPEPEKEEAKAKEADRETGKEKPAAEAADSHKNTLTFGKPKSSKESNPFKFSQEKKPEAAPKTIHKLQPNNMDVPKNASALNGFDIKDSKK